MKKQPIENLRSKVIFVSLAIMSSFLLIINFIPIFIVNAGITTEFTGDLDIDRVAYVNQSSPDMHFFDPLWGNAVIGNSCETFVHFNLELLPKETEELYFFLWSFNFRGYEAPVEDIEINIILVESNWSDSEITWNNKPQHEFIIETVNASEILQSPFVERYNLKRAVDLTEIFKDNQLNELSLCINITENNAELNASVYLDGIQLIWNYEKLIISYTTIISSVIIFSMLIGTVYYIRKDIHSCPECTTKRKLTERICSSCGTSINNETIIKSSDYQLVLILLWVFAFFEVIFILLTVLPDFYFLLNPLIIFLVLIPWVILCTIQIIRKIKKYRDLRFSLG
ncbi:MAG: hypothetical protein CEE43_15875 [Promethearchaeota archaeon Loki_b32]|nr:MAG: hypothetical protein CEE43_15875 [Candidatus Lokiarchaeota archaeon Loki_b32]